MRRTIRTAADVLSVLDRLSEADADRWTKDASRWWETFYSDRGQPVPFFAPAPLTKATISSSPGS